MTRSLAYFVSILAWLFLLLPLGPRVHLEPVSPDIPDFDLSIEQLDRYLNDKESNIPNLKPNNHSQIIWYDSVRKTDYAMVYIHGFSAGIMESDPVHRQLAEKYGMNLYLHRIKEHGIDDPEVFQSITPADLVNSAKEALAIGQLIGDKVILLSCSTGSTYSIYLTAHNPELVHSLILYSPNIRLYDPRGSLVTGPWGKQLVNQLVGEYRIAKDTFFGTEIENYWTLKYRSEGIITVQSLLEQTMTPEVFEKIRCPYFLGYYYKSDEESDHVVSTEAMQEFHLQTTTPEDKKQIMAFPNVGNHVMASSLQSKDIESVISETSGFIEEVLEIKPYNQN